jgi:uncharacterized membrane protein YoaK (UPF0700 family)
MGTLGAGLIGTRVGLNRGRLLASAATIQVIFLGASVILSVLSGDPVANGYEYGVIIALAVSMGLQNATARKLGVPDLTTTVLTLTITGIGADSRLVGGTGSRLGRRLTSVLAMFVGGLFGALTILYLSVILPVALALILTAIVAVAIRMLSGRDLLWVRFR